GCGVCEIACIGGGTLDHLQAACPAKLQGLLFVDRGAWWSEHILHLLLECHLEGLGRRSTLGRVGECYLLNQTRVAEIRPGSRYLAHAKPPQRIGVVADPKGRKSGSDPASASIVEDFPGNRVGKGTLFEHNGPFLLL